jgi:hypothetical protein
MSRIIIWPAVLAIAGLVLLWGTSDAERGLSLQEPSISYGGWMGGLVVGLALAWLIRVEWSAVPERLALWARTQRRRLAWAVVGSICAAILLYF